MPSEGNPGIDIIINTQYANASTSTASNKFYNMVNEIGHSMGFYHTNEDGFGGSVHIPGTPTSDLASVMNGGTALYSRNGFSANDIIAAQLVYPIDANGRWITSPETNYPIPNN